MRIFNLLLLAGTLFSQSVTVELPEKNISFLANDSLSAAISLDSLAGDDNNLSSEFRLESISSDSIIRAEYSEFHWELTVDSLVFAADQTIAPAVQGLIFKRLKGSTPWAETNKKLAVIRNSHSFLNANTSYQLARYRTDNLAAVVNVNPQFASTFSGILGMSRNENSQWEMNGQLDLHLENAWNSAGTFDLNWRRRNELSQNLALELNEPFPLGLPFGVMTSFRQDLEEGLFVKRNAALGIITTMALPGTWRTGIENTSVTATAKGDSAGIDNVQNRFLFIDWSGDARDDRWLPGSGRSWYLLSAFGENTQVGIASRVWRIKMQWDSYYGLFGNFVGRIKFWLDGTDKNTGDIHTADMVKYGGVNNLRGYREDLFQSPWVAVPQLELIYQGSSNLRLLVFADAAFQEKYDPVPFGFGIGLVQRTAGTLIEVSYGLSRDDLLSQGKIHFKVTGIL